jgi:hypothetical protein
MECSPKNVRDPSVRIAGIESCFFGVSIIQNFQSISYIFFWENQSNIRTPFNY